MDRAPPGAITHASFAPLPRSVIPKMSLDEAARDDGASASVTATARATSASEIVRSTSGTIYGPGSGDASAIVRTGTHARR